MSLILDALEQAEHERQAQQALEPGGTLPALAAARHSGAPSARFGWLWWAAGGAACALAGLLAWQRWGTATPTPMAQQTQPGTARLPALPGAAPTLPATALFAPQPPVLARAATAAGAATPAAQPAVGPTPAPSAETASVPAPVQTNAPATSPVAATAATSAAIAPTALPPPPATAAAPAPPLPLASELPPQARARLPNLTITGHTYSDNPTLRTLMIDGRMLVEGQTLAPGLRLERIERHQAVFNQGGTRFGVGY